RAWLAAWEQAVRRVADRVIEALDGRIERAARRVRMPHRRWRRRLLSTPEKRAVTARLATGGEPFVAALDALDAVAARVRDASVLDKAAHAEWQEALRGAARRLEAAWLALEGVEVARVSAILNDKGSRVLERLLTPAERAYCESRPDVATHVAVRLAAKEAVYKALQGSQAARGIGWRDIEVTRAPDGRPDVSLSGSATARARELGVQRVLLSLTHTHLAAIAIAVLERD